MRQLGVWFVSLLILVIMSTNLLNLPVEARRRPSRLSQLVLRDTQVFLPPRLTLGETATFQIRGLPNERVILFYASSKADGLTLPSGQQLKVAQDSPYLQGTLNDKGLLSLALEVPDDESIVGQVIFLDAIHFQQSNMQDAKPVRFLSSTGRQATVAQLLVHAPKSEAKSSAPLIIPAAPGLDSQALRQATTNATILNGDNERKKELLDFGSIRNEDPLQRNALQNQPKNGF